MWDYEADTECLPGAMATALAKALRSSAGSGKRLFNNAAPAGHGPRFSTAPKDSDTTNHPGTGYQYISGPNGQHD